MGIQAIGLAVRIMRAGQIVELAVNTPHLGYGAEVPLLVTDSVVFTATGSVLVYWGMCIGAVMRIELLSTGVAG